jgi:hypothetical protein
LFKVYKWIRVSTTNYYAAPDSKNPLLPTDGIPGWGYPIIAIERPTRFIFMEGQKPTTDARINENSRLWEATLLEVLLGECAWYGVVQLSVWTGVLRPESISGYVAAGVMVLILPAAWWHRRRAVNG